MSVIGSRYIVGPAIIGNFRYVSNGKKKMYGAGFKEFASSAWNMLKPILGSVLRNDKVHEGIKNGASKLADRLEGKGLSVKGKKRLDQLLGDGVRYLA